MDTTKRLLNMILRGHPDKFKAILQEELNERASVILEKVYRIETQNTLKPQPCTVTEQTKPTHKTKKITPKFLPEKMYTLRDGNIGILTESERLLIGELHENLNTDGKERMLKLLSESQESFNKVLKLAKKNKK